MRKWRGFADNGACPVVPTGGETCRKEGQAPLITESALSLLWKTLEWEGGYGFPVAPLGLTSELVFGQGFHCIPPPAYSPPSLWDLGTS